MSLAMSPYGRRMPRLLPLAAAIGLMFQMSAHAQQQSSAPAVASGGSSAATEERSTAEKSSLELVIVTAQRRAQKVSDVPISMTSVSGSALEERGVTSLHEVAEQVSSAQVYRTAAGQPTWIIRGVGLIDFSPNNTPTAAIYQDDVYLVSNALSQLSLFDVARVEVLKGPQGGIYGRNTSGGAVRVMSNLAEFGPSDGEIGFALGNTGVLRAKGYVAGTVLDNRLAVRLAADVSEGGAGRMRLITSDRKWGRMDQGMLRGSVQFRPSDDVRITALVEGGVDRSQVLAQNAVGYASVSGKAPGYWCAPVLAGQLDNRSCLTYGAFINTVVKGIPGTNDASLQDPGRSSIADPYGQFDIRTAGTTVNADFGLGSAKLVSVTHVRSYDYGRSADSDGVTGEFAHTHATSNFGIASQEFRLQSMGNQRLKWTLGASYMRDKLDEDRIFDFRDNVGYVRSFASYGVTSPAQLSARLAYTQVTRSASVYGQTDYALTETLNLGLALRYTDERKTYRNGGFGFPTATGAVAAAVAPIAGYTLGADYKLDSPWSGKLSLDWKPIPEVMTYASVSRGFKVGGFFGGFPLNGVAAILPYKEETVLAYELGFKTDAARRDAGLSGAIYRYNYSDAQNFTTVFSSLLNRTIVRMDNIGRARHDGAELEAWWSPLRGLRLQASIGVLDARFIDDKSYVTLDGQIANYRDQKRPYAPRQSGSLGGSYGWSLADGGGLRVAADLNSRSRLMQSFGSAVDQAIGSLPGYTLLNLNAHYTAPNGRLQLGVVVRNALDKTYAVTYANDGLGSYTRFYGEPRTVTLQGSYAF